MVQVRATEFERYQRHLRLPEVGPAGQKKLKNARVLIVGVGGLGSPAALYLAAAGIGTLGLADQDSVELSNLQRQILYGGGDLGVLKLDAARRRLEDLNSDIRIQTHPERLTAANARAVINGYDIVLDGSDNFPTRYLVNDACALTGKPDVFASVSRFEGELSVFWAERGPCYRCLHPEPPPPGTVADCADGGVLGVLPGVLGTLQAAEAIKLVLGAGEPLLGRLLLFNALAMDFKRLNLPKRADCPACGPNAVFDKLIDYPQFCATQEEKTPMSDEKVPEITVQDLKAKIDAKENIVILDVREPHEYELCKLPGSKLIPLGDIPNRYQELDKGSELIVHCRSGKRSAQAVNFLRQQGFEKAVNVAGGILAWAEKIDPSMPSY